MAQDSARRVGIVKFEGGIEIAKSTLDRAIGGGIKRANPSGVSRQQRDEIFSTVYLMLVKRLKQDKPIIGSVGSLAYKIAYRAAIDTYRRPDAYERRRSYAIDVSEAQPTAGMISEAPDAEAFVMQREEHKSKRCKITAALKTLSETDRSALIEAVYRTVVLGRKTPEETKVANLICQREKRARDRLAKAYCAHDRER